MIPLRVDLQIDPVNSLVNSLHVDLRIDPASNLVKIDPNMPKNPLNVARAYTDMQRIKDLDLDMYQRAFLSIRERKAFNLLLFSAVYLSQTALFLMVWFYAISGRKNGESIIESPGGPNTVPIVIVILISTGLFIYDAWQSWIFEVRQRLSHYSHQISVDLFVNLYLALCPVGFNAYFLLFSETPFDTVLNSLALGFIYHIERVCSWCT